MVLCIVESGVFGFMFEIFREVFWVIGIGYSFWVFGSVVLVFFFLGVGFVCVFVYVISRC